MIAELELEKEVEAVAAVDEERFTWAHCSNHQFWMNGCNDCSLINLLAEQSDFESYFAKSDIVPLEIRIKDPNPRFQLIRQQLARVFAMFFAKAKKKAVAAALTKTREFVKFGKTEQLTEKQKEAIILAAYTAIRWNELIDGVTTDLLAAAQSGAAEGLIQVQDSSEETVAKVNDFSQEYARNRAAEMIGKKYEEDTLVENPTAKFVIANTTKDDLRDVIEQSFEKQETLTELQERILNAATFSDLRSQLIATNEVALAQVAGNLVAWKNQVSKVAIRLSDDHTVYDQCDLLVENGPYDINHVPLIPSHPHCHCVLYAINEDL